MITVINSLEPEECLHRYLLRKYTIDTLPKKLTIDCKYKPYSTITSMYPQTTESGRVVTPYGTTVEMQRNMEKGGVCRINVFWDTFMDRIEWGMMDVMRVYRVLPTLGQDGYDVFDNDDFAYPANIFSVSAVSSTLIDKLRIK